MAHDVKALKLQIEQAFAGSSRPAESDIVYQNEGHQEAREIREAFSGKTWQQLDAKLAQYHHDALSFFSPNGFVHYLPAWLHGSFDQSNDLAQYAVFALNPPADAKERARFEKKMAGFSAPQKKAIASWLQYVQDDRKDEFGNGEPAAALKFWKI